MKVCENVSHGVEGKPCVLVPHVVQKDDAVAVHEVHDAWIGCPQAPTQGLQQLVDAVGIDGVDYARAHEQRLVQGVPIDAEQRKRGVYALVRAEAIE